MAARGVPHLRCKKGPSYEQFVGEAARHLSRIATTQSTQRRRCTHHCAHCAHCAHRWPDSFGSSYPIHCCHGTSRPDARCWNGRRFLGCASAGRNPGPYRPARGQRRAGCAILSPTPHRPGDRGRACRSDQGNRAECRGRRDSRYARYAVYPRHAPGDRTNGRATGRAAPRRVIWRPLPSRGIRGGAAPASARAAGATSSTLRPRNTLGHRFSRRRGGSRPPAYTLTQEDARSVMCDPAGVPSFPAQRAGAGRRGAVTASRTPS